MPYLAFATICLLFGSNFYLMALADDAYGPVAIGAWRVTGAAIVLFALWRLLVPEQKIPRAAWGKITAVGLIANGYPYVVQPWLITQFGHSYFGMMVSFVPLLTILVSIPLLGVWPRTRQLTGVLVGLVFMALMVVDGDARGIPPLMLLLAVSVPLSYALANTYMRRALSDVPSTALTAGILTPPMLLLLPLSAMHGPLTAVSAGPPAEPTNLATATLALAILGPLGTGATMWLFVRLVQQQGPLFAGMVTYVVPVIALGWGMVDGETITTRQVIAIAGVLFSVALVQYGAVSAGERKPSPAGGHTTAATGEV